MGDAMLKVLDMRNRQFTVKAEWDAEAGVWYVAESDVPGLVAEADTLEELAKDLMVLVPEMLELNAHLLDEPIGVGAVPLHLVANKQLELCS